MKPILTLASFYAVFMAAPAYAYLDPITGSVLLQAIIGGVASAMIAIRRVREKLLSFVGIGKSDNAAASREDHTSQL